MCFSHLPCGRNNGSKQWITFKVPMTFVFMVSSACSTRGSTTTFCTNNKITNLNPNTEDSCLGHAIKSSKLNKKLKTAIVDKLLKKLI